MTRRTLQRPVDLYDGTYDDSLKGRWRCLSPLTPFVLVVEGRGSKAGTVAAHAEHDPDNRQEDMPITTLHRRYARGLR